MGVLASSPDAQAASGTWLDATPNSANWHVPGNWADGSLPNGIGDSATLQFSTARTVVVNDETTLGYLRLATTAGAFSLADGGGYSLIMENTGGVDAKISLFSAASNAIISAPIKLTGSGLAIEADAGTGGISITGPISSMAEEGTQVLSLKNGGGNVLSANGTISDGIYGGQVAFRADGGTVSLSGTNTFTGGVTVRNGSLRAGSLSLGSGTLTMGDSLTTAAITFAPLASGTYSNNIVVSTLGTGVVAFTSAISLAGDVVYTGNVAVGRGVTFNANNTTGKIVLKGVVSGTGALTIGQTGGGVSRVVEVAGANTHTGGLNSNGVNFRVDISNAAAPGTGRWTIGSGGTTQANNLQIDNTSGAALTLANNNLLTINNFTYVGSAHDMNMGTGAVTISSTAAIVTVLDKNLTFGGVISGANKSFGNSGPGRLTLTADNTYTGRTTVGGILAETSLKNGAVASNIGSSSNAAANLVINRGTLQYNGEATSTDRLFTIGNGGGGIESNGAGALEFTNTGNIVSADAGTVALASAAYASGTNILVLSANAASHTADLAVGMSITGTGIPADTVITKILDGGRIEISNNTNAAAPVSGNLTFGALDRTFTLSGSNTGNNLIAGSFADSATKKLSIDKTGTGKWVLTGASTHTGQTNVKNGTLEIKGAGDINSSAVHVSAGARFAFNSSVARSGVIVLNGNGSNRAVLSGTGKINTALVLDDIGDTLAPGNSVALMELGVGQSWESFTYEWELNDFAAGGVAGTNFDQIQITGGLSLTGDAYVFDLRSLNALDLAGDVANFAEIDRSWTVLTTTGGITGFDLANWTIQTGGFTAASGWAGSWSLAQVGNDVVLSYSTIPEPHTAAMWILGSGVLLMMARRKAGKAQQG